MAYPNPPNNTDLAEYVQYSNTITDGWGGTIILLLIFAVSIIVMYRVEGPKRFAFAGFFTGIFALGFRVLEIIPEQVFFVALVVLALSVFGLFVSSGD